MDVEGLKQLGCTEDIAKAIMLRYEKEKSVLDEENKRLKASISGYETKVGELEKFKGTADELTAKLAAIQAERKADAEKFSKEMSEFKRNSAVRQALGSMKSKPHDEKIVMGQLDLSKVSVLDDGKVLGLEEQVNELQSKMPFLFAEPNDRRGKTPPASTSSQMSASKPKAEAQEPVGIGERIAKRMNERQAALSTVKQSESD